MFYSYTFNFPRLHPDKPPPNVPTREDEEHDGQNINFVNWAVSIIQFSSQNSAARSAQIHTPSTTSLFQYHISNSYTIYISIPILYISFSLLPSQIVRL